MAKIPDLDYCQNSSQLIPEQKAIAHQPSEDISTFGGLSGVTHRLRLFPRSWSDDYIFPGLSDQLFKTVEQHFLNKDIKILFFIASNN